MSKMRWQSIAAAAAVILSMGGAAVSVPASAAETAAVSIEAAAISDAASHNFTTQGLNSEYFSISGNLATGKGTANYAGQTLTQCLKMESATSITFSTTGNATMTLAILEGSTLVIDGAKHNLDGSGTLTVQLGAGSHSIAKGSGSSYLFYIDIKGEGSSPAVTTAAPTPAEPQQTTAAQGGTPVIAPVAGAVYCSPNGSGSGASANDPTSLLNAISAAKAGTTIYCLAGTYKLSETVDIKENQSGSSGKYITLSVAPGVAPSGAVFDFSAQKTADTARGFILEGSYWHFYGVKIQYAGDNGMLLAGDNNIIEYCEFFHNQDTGLQVSRYNGSYASVSEWPSNNIILNCSSHDNCDDATMENADGFAAKLTCGQGNVFDGCMAYNNSDDGWDLYAKEATGPIGVVTLQNCIAFRNGFTSDGRGYGDCDGNGFKLGGGGVGSAHIVKNCLAFENLNCGFTDNNNPKLGSLTSCTAYNNGIGGKGKANYMVYRCTGTVTKFDKIISYTNTSKVSQTKAAGIKLSNDKFVGSASNTIYYNGKYYYVKNATTLGNGSKLGDTVSLGDGDFKSLSVAPMGTDFHKAWRNANGSVKTGGFAETSGTYGSIGYHMDGGYASVIQPSGAPTAPAQTEPPVTTTAATTTTTVTTAATTTTAAATTTTANAATAVTTTQTTAAAATTAAVTTTAAESATTTTTTAAAAATTVTSSAPAETTTTETVPASAVLRGDADTSGEVDISDVVLIARVAAEDSEVTISAEGKRNADVNGNGRTDLDDATMILKYIARLITAL